jgi:hypothetical protein
MTDRCPNHLGRNQTGGSTMRALGWLLLIYSGWVWWTQATATTSGPAYLVVTGGLGLLLLIVAEIAGTIRGVPPRRSRWQRCSDCHGAGSFSGLGSAPCATCKGCGGWYWEQRFGSPPDFHSRDRNGRSCSRWERCPSCRGARSFVGAGGCPQKCSECKGNGGWGWVQIFAER